MVHSVDGEVTQWQSLNQFLSTNIHMACLEAHFRLQPIKQVSNPTFQMDLRELQTTYQDILLYQYGQTMLQLIFNLLEANNLQFNLKLTDGLILILIGLSLLHQQLQEHC